jgi:acyl-CoA reductase-like NAD-dependent aldehyde dehydrogenase
MIVKSVNPATGEINGEFETVSGNDAVKLAKVVKHAFSGWRDMPIDRRISLLRVLAGVLRKRRSEYARLITIEMGKPISDSIKEIDSCVNICEATADNAKNWLAEEEVKTEYSKSFISFEPLGLVLAVMPWNYPFSQVLRCAVPSLAAGNVVLVRHSNVVPMCSLALEKAFEEAGFPDNIFRTVITDHPTVYKLIKSWPVDAVSFTGGADAGRAVSKLAAAQIKKCVLELGGSNAFIVLEDCDIELAAKRAVESRVKNAGQACTSSKRFIVVERVAKKFADRVIESAKSVKMGNPLELDTMLGPLANAQQLETVQSQVEDALEKGAVLGCGGRRAGAAGNFYELTVLTQVKRGMRVMKEEVFGPVIPIITVKNESEAIRIANSLDFGLGASIWTKDKARGEAIAMRMEAGMACVNRLSNSEPRMPFGGVKKSGIGREFSRYGILEFTNIKSIIVSD